MKMTNIGFRQIDIIKDEAEILNLWNKEWSTIYPIDHDLFVRNYKFVLKNLAYCATYNDTIIGFIIGKTYQENFIIPNYEGLGWISLIYVAGIYRNQGIGTKLLYLVESEIEKLKKNCINIGRDLFNYFPGLPVDMKNSLKWFQNRGYSNPYNTYDLICKKTKDELPLVNDNKIFRLASVADYCELLEFMNNNWPGRWTKEVIDYFENGGTGREYLLCIMDNKIVGFVKIGYPNTLTKLESYSLTWRNRFDSLGGIGPLGVDKNYRLRHFGLDLISYARNILFSKEVSASEIIIDWTGLTDLYRKAGFEVWKSYFYLSKEIIKGDLNK